MRACGRPEADYETAAARRHRLSRVTVTVFLAGSLGLLMWLAGRITGQPVFGFLFWLPLFAWFASRWLVRGGELLIGWSRRQVWRDLNGSHHAFDDIWIRIEAAGRGNFRIRADDIFRALAQPMDDLAYRKLAIRFTPGGLTQDISQRWWFGDRAALAYLRERAGRHDGRALRLALWLERQVLPPLMRRQHLEISRDDGGW